VNFGALKGEQVIKNFCDKGNCLFRADWWFGGSLSVMSGSAIIAGGFITIVGAIDVSCVIGAVFIEGHELDHAAWGPPQRRQVETTASHLFGAWVWGHLHAGLLGHAVTWWPSWKHLLANLSCKGRDVMRNTVLFQLTTNL
jgi:hypothetical protein